MPVETKQRFLNHIVIGISESRVHKPIILVRSISLAREIRENLKQGGASRALILKIDDLVLHAAKIQPSRMFHYAFILGHKTVSEATLGLMRSAVEEGRLSCPANACELLNLLVVEANGAYHEFGRKRWFLAAGAFALGEGDFGDGTNHIPDRLLKDHDQAATQLYLQACRVQYPELFSISRDERLQLVQRLVGDKRYTSEYLKMKGVWSSKTVKKELLNTTHGTTARFRFWKRMIWVVRTVTLQLAIANRRL